MSNNVWFLERTRLFRGVPLHDIQASAEDFAAMRLARYLREPS
jgi:hypothetical protein